MDARRELLDALNQMDLSPEQLDLEYDDANGCWVLIRRHPGYQDPDQSPEDTVAAFFQSDKRSTPLAHWLMDQIRSCTAHSEC